MAKLKVFRTAAGFHDAYVATPSRAAALRAWGSDADLFARGVAEEVTDPALMEAPLARPGEVIKVSRGSAAEQLAAVAAAPKRAAKRDAPTAEKAAPSPPPKPKPSRAALDKAEAALDDAKARHAAEMRDLAAEQEALDRRKADAAKAQKAERAKLEAATEREQATYEAALDKWRG